jgi:hypothetical protein
MIKRILLIGAIGFALVACTPSDGASDSPTLDPIETTPAESLEASPEIVDPSASPS